MVVQSGQDEDCTDATKSLGCPTQGRILLERQVRSCLVVIGGVRRENSPQMLDTHDQHLIKTFTPDCAYQPLHMPILPR